MSVARGCHLPLLLEDMKDYQVVRIEYKSKIVDLQLFGNSLIWNYVNTTRN
jgi:hypothetical protein